MISYHIVTFVPLVNLPSSWIVYTVELARWEIPLILVARDLPRLTSLAYDLEACYGVRCCILQADLSQPHAAEQIHQATTKAGLRVDILVNNAGISSNGLAVDMPSHDVERMIQVNAMSVAKLAHLYGKDMKEKRRGRILMVSSVVGAVAAGPTVALYAATKAFEKVLASSMAKELEPYGVGVTCLMPGAVSETDFRSSSSTHEALCWKLPFYPKTPKTVAKVGIRALLRGDVEVTPGWQNRVFLKVVQPALPQRLHNIIVELAWNPLRIPSFLVLWKSADKRREERQAQLEERIKHVQDEEDDDHTKQQYTQEWLPRQNAFVPPPLLLTIPGKTPAPAPKTVPGIPEPAESEFPPPAPNLEGSATGEDPEVAEQPIRTYEDELNELRKLSLGNDGGAIPEAKSEDNNSTAGSSSLDDSTPSTAPAPAPPSSDSKVEELKPKEQHLLLQLQNQLLKLQKQVQEQEQQQFLQQIEQQRQQRELEYENRR
jgi:short-subunit dehydrogenase